MAIQRISCLECGGSTFTRNELNHLVCTHCGSAFALKGNVCPNCSTVNEARAASCVECGHKLKRKCISCGHENNVTAEMCANCNGMLDTLEFVSQRYREAQQDQSTRRAGIVGGSKREDADTLANIHAEFAEQERQRLVELQQRQTTQSTQERNMFLVAVAFGVVVLLGIVLFVLFAAMMRGGGL